MKVINKDLSVSFTKNLINYLVALVASSSIQVNLLTYGQVGWVGWRWVWGEGDVKASGQPWKSPSDGKKSRKNIRNLVRKKIKMKN